jgi:hypothetical protein
MVEWLSERVSKMGVDVTIVANKSNFAGISANLPESNVVVNAEPQKGRTGSLKVGVSRIDSTKGANYRLLVVPVESILDTPTLSEPVLPFCGSAFTTTFDSGRFADIPAKLDLLATMVTSTPIFETLSDSHSTMCAPQSELVPYPSRVYY